MNSPEDSFARLTNRLAVVTGASSGIGRAIAVELARAGADVVVHFRQNRAGAEQTARLIDQLGRSARLLQADLGEDVEREAFVAACFEPPASPDIWINNAGVDLLTGAARDWEYARKLQALLDVDVTASLLLARRVGAKFRDQQSGVIINIGWDQAERGMEGESGELFAAAKNAIMGFSRSLAVSLAPHVRVNCVAPGWIRTAWGAAVGEQWQQRVLAETPLQRWGEPEDIARLVRFLVSDEASYLTGQVIYANGGAER